MAILYSEKYATTPLLKETNYVHCHSVRGRQGIKPLNTFVKD